MLKKLFVACLFLATCAAYAKDADSGSFKSTYSFQDVALETDLLSDFWRNTQPIYAQVDDYGEVVGGYSTEIRSRWTEKYLYLLFVCPYKELYLKPLPDVHGETNGLWNWDVAELFIGSDFVYVQRYKEFEVSPRGEWVDLNIDLDLPDHTVGWTWNSGFEVSARIDAKAKVWFGAMKIPFAALDIRPPVEGRVFRANLFRSQGPPGRRVSIAWKAPMSDTFHTPARFGRLVLVKHNGMNGKAAALQRSPP